MIDKVIHSAVGLGIKLSVIYQILIGLVVVLTTALIGIFWGISALFILSGLVIYRGAWLAGWVKEEFDFWRGSYKYPNDIRATQDSSIVLEWYKDKIKK